MLNMMVNNRDRIEGIEINELDKNIEAMLLLTLSEEEKEISNSFVNIKFENGEPIFIVNRYDFQRAAEEARGGGEGRSICSSMI